MQGPLFHLLAVLVLAAATCGCGKDAAGPKGGDDQLTFWPKPDTKIIGDDDAGGTGEPETTTLDDDDVEAPDGLAGEGATQPDDDAAGTPPDVAVTPDVGQPKDCIDKDGDLYGKNCYLGKDCDDTNPHFTIYCPPCETQNAPGCKCWQEGLAEVCYEGDPGSVGVGECQLGQRYCQQGYWTSCVGQVMPKAEVCDGLDNDCDSTTDEGVLSPCGDCDPNCDMIKVGPGGLEEFEPTPENSEKVGKNMDGFLVLDSKQIDLAFMWVSNSGENTVSKLDTSLCKETGRYRVCSNPSRTSVDLDGSVWVGCRSDGGVAKIAIDEAICVDKNQDGSIQTSKDQDGNGKINGAELLPPGQDECIQFIVYPGGSCQRGLGVDQDNHAWVGEWYGKVIRRLRPEDGATVQQIGISTNPYGLIVDQKGIIWISGRGTSRLVKVDPKLGAEVGAYYPTIGCFEPYGIGLDHQGRVWIGNCCCAHVGYRFDPETNTWASAQVKNRPRGVAGSQDGNTYIANDESNHVAAVDSDSMQVLGYINLGGGKFPIGMTVDFEGFVWTANQSSASAIKIDATDPANMKVVCEVPVGSSPYTYSDMTGYALHNFTAPQGHYAHVFGGWEGFRVKWVAVYVDVDYQDPENCFVKVRVRTGNDKDELASKPWQGYYGPYPPANFPLDLMTVPDMDGKLLEVEVTLFSQSKKCTPMVKSIEAKFASE
jgi:streptogramin lyase